MCDRAIRPRHSKSAGGLLLASTAIGAALPAYLRYPNPCPVWGRMWLDTTRLSSCWQSKDAMQRRDHKVHACCRLPSAVPTCLFRCES
ncbi:uncharacterized protein B0I36DRAFT_334140 [Microdochium trichocladiopsis]|uniref:Uncharacterized protein n=1 Tax=Microdochium trichocladiopsis TaxID=1682393 RepID=A0A9P8XW39_9PEZI|nr:uncharacterized protein B0I36DRAFT_334140 [Microdochium trichocladiopsis]KAH7021260.1 hypothetical protein B0I36DRAFT_334140 [Microdochium trichocladiopsis]